MADLAAPAIGTGRAGGIRAEVVAALGFLTRIPVVAPSTPPATNRALSRTRTGAAAFGVVGAAIGSVAALPVLLLGAAHPVPAAVAAVGLLALLSGGLHLDGLADTFDALAAPSGSAERARTDPRTGTAGVIALVVVLGLDAAALAELASTEPLLGTAALVAAVSLSRAAAAGWAAVVGHRFAPRDGLGAWFAATVSRSAAGVASLTALAATVFLVAVSSPVLAGGVVLGIPAAIVAGALIVRARGQLDGDGYGAIVELSVSCVLLATILVPGGPAR